MIEQSSEQHHCPFCNQNTRHLVSRERKLAPVLWCQSCFRVRVEENAPKAKEAKQHVA